MATTNIQTFSGDVEVAGTLTVSGTLTSTTGVDTVALATDATDASRPIIFSTGTTGSQPLKTDAGITYNPSTNTLSVAGGIDNVALATDATDASRPIIFSTGTTGSQPLKTDAGITYNPSTNTLSVAGGIDNVALATDATDAARPIIFSTGTTGSQPLKTDAGITYNPSTNKLSVAGGLSTSISPGDYLTGTAYDGSTARTFAVDATSANTASKVVARDASGNFTAGTITAALTGNADTATTLQTARNINGVSFDGSDDITVTANTPTTLTRGNYLTGDNFNGGTGTTWAVDATDANTASKVVARDASGNFSAGTITAALTGNASTASQVNVTSRDNTNETHYPTFTTTHDDGNTDLYQDSGFTYNPSSGTLTSTTFAGALSGNASTASQVNVTSRDSEDASHYPTFTTTDADGNANLYQDAGFYYNPSSGTLSSTTFSGALSGNADTATQVNVTSRDSVDASHYPTFTTTDADGNASLYQDAGFTYNPSSGTLTSTTFSGALTGNADTATTATNQSGGTVSATSGTFSGGISFTDSGTTKRGIQGEVGGNDQWFVGGGATATNAGFMEIATGDDAGTEPIYARQYQGTPLTGTVQRTLTLLDGSGNSSFPGTVTATSGFTGDVTGNADTATQVYVTSRDSTDASHYPTFTTTDGDGNTNLYQDAGFTYNPSTGTLTSTVFSGTNGTFSGNVGIGTASPAYKLHIRSGTASALLLESDNGGTGYPVNIDFRNYNAQEPPGARISVTDDIDYGSDIRFLTKTGSGGTGALSERMIIQGAGNVGIGTASPLQPLHVKGNGENPVIYMSDATNNRYSSGMGTHHIAGVGQRFDFYNGDSGANGTSLSSSHIRMSIDTNGNVGIGTVSPRSALDVSGTIISKGDSFENLLDPTGTWSNNGSATPGQPVPSFTLRYVSNNLYPGYDYSFLVSQQQEDGSFAYVYKTLNLKGPSWYTLSGARKVIGGSFGNRVRIQVYDNTNSTSLFSNSPNNTVGEWLDFEYPFYISDDIEVEVRLGGIYNVDGEFAPNLCLNKGGIPARRVHRSLLGVKGDSVILANGNVGIGINSPETSFHVVNPNATNPTWYNQSYLDDSACIMVSENNYNVETVRDYSTHYTTLILSSDHAYDSGHNAAGSVSFAAKNEFGGYSTQYGQISGVRLGSFYGGLSFATMHNLNDGKLREDMRIINGNVGIGVTNPTRSLQIERGISYISGGTSNNSAFEIVQQLGTDDYTYLGQHKAQFRINNGLGTYSNRSLELALLDNGRGVMQANAGSEGYFPISINPVGGYDSTVSIGSYYSSAKLRVEGNVYATSIIQSANQVWGTGFQNPTATTYLGQSYSYPTEIAGGGHIRFKSDDVERMRIVNSGNVGIGKTNPNIPLDVGNALENPRIGRDLNFGSVHDADKRDSVYFGRRDGTELDFLGMQCRVDTHTALGYGSYSNQTKIGFHTWGNNYAASREVMCINGAGNVGIGTVSPLSTFQIGYNTGAMYNNNPLNDNTISVFGKGVTPTTAANSDMNATLFLSTNDAFAENKGSSIALAARHYNFGAGNQHLTCARISGVASGGFSGDFVVETQNGGSLYERLRILPNGNVGIGTTSPSTKLHVYEESGTPVSQLQSNGDARSVYSSYINSANSRAGYCGLDGTGLFGHSTGALALGTNDTPIIFSPYYSTGEKMRITTDGNVGIGTQGPTARLTLWCDHDEPADGSSVATAKPEIGLVWRNNLVTSGSGSTIPHWYRDTSRDSASIWYQPRSYSSVSSGDLGVHGAIRFNCNWTGTETTRMTITSLGRVGIGVTTPAYLLDVNGNFRAYGVTDSSDRRIKKNIVDVNDTSALETIRLLKPKKYDYRDAESRTHETVWGFIAQDVREVLPYATDVISDYIPNVMEYVNVSSSNVLTFDTSVLESNVVSLRLKDIHGVIRDVTIDEIIDGNTIRVIEDLDEWTGSFDAEGNVITAITTTTITVEEYEALEDTTGYESTADGYTKTTTTYPGSQIFVYGQKVHDFHTLNKSAIWTVATAALQEVDRQLQAEKAKVATLETQLASVLARLDALEGA